MASNDVLSLLFGKKKKKRSNRGKTGGKKSKGKLRRIRAGYCIKKTKSGKRIVKVYRFKRGTKYLKGKRYRNKRPCKGKTYKTKSAAKRAMKPKKSSFGRRVKRSSVRRRRSAFGVGGSYMPLSSVMSPYPSSVDASPPWASFGRRRSRFF